MKLKDNKPITSVVYINAIIMVITTVIAIVFPMVMKYLLDAELSVPLLVLYQSCVFILGINVSMNYLLRRIHAYRAEQMKADQEVLEAVNKELVEAINYQRKISVSITQANNCRACEK